MFQIRNLRPEDHLSIVEAIPEWWGGRDVRSALPKVFTLHFASTSFVAECEGHLAGFLVAFMSPTCLDEAYIHFVGVSPKFRKQNLAAQLYEKFFNLARAQKRSKVRCCTSPVNTGSIAFHKKMGFILEEGDSIVDGYPVTLDHNQKGDSKVRFLKIL